MDPFMNQGDQLDQGGKLMWKVLVEKIDKIQCSVHCV